MKGTGEEEGEKADFKRKMCGTGKPKKKVKEPPTPDASPAVRDPCRWKLYARIFAMAVDVPAKKKSGKDQEDMRRPFLGGTTFTLSNH